MEPIINDELPEDCFGGEEDKGETSDIPELVSISESLRIRIWYDMIHAKNGDEYLTLYLAREKRWRIGYKLGLIAITTGGLVAWDRFPIAPIISLFIIWISQLITQVENLVIMSDDNFSKLGALRMMYYERWVKLEDLWFDIYDCRIDSDKSSYLYSITRKEAREIEKLDNDLLIKTHNRLMCEAEKKTKDYINQYHGTTTIDTEQQ